MISFLDNGQLGRTRNLVTSCQANASNVLSSVVTLHLPRVAQAHYILGSCWQLCCGPLANCSERLTTLGLCTWPLCLAVLGTPVACISSLYASIESKSTINAVLTHQDAAYQSPLRFLPLRLGPRPVLGQ